MLGEDLIGELRTIFGSLSSNIELVYDESAHSSQSELLEMLQDVAASSERIHVIQSGQSSQVPTFQIGLHGATKKISVRGIPGGHEFSSLVLAVLNADGKGKMPDSGIQDRIRALRGPVRIKTYISLTCENCPDVVQALNQMALIHPDFHHEMVDGGFAQDEIDSLGIQGVPSIVVDGKMIHSGRIHFLDLLVKLEEVFGKSESAAKAQVRDLGLFDTVILGGGPAGVSAAIYSARKGLKTALVAERMGGQVKETKGIENLISVTYTEGPQLAESLQKHLAAYDVKIFDQRRVAEISENRVITLESGETIRGDATIIATGAKWRELNVPGEKEYLGRGVAYCPHCDGPFYKGKAIAVIGGGNSGVEAAIDLAGIAKSVVLLEFGDALRADKVLIDKLNSMGNTKVILSAQTKELIGNGQKIVGLAYTERISGAAEELPIDGVFIQIGLIPNSGFAGAAVKTNKFGEIIVDERGRTNIAGIYAAGDVATTPFKQIIIAMGDGAKVALAAFDDRIRNGSH